LANRWVSPEALAHGTQKIF